MIDELGAFMSTMPISKAIALSLGRLNQPIITAYQLGRLLWRLYATGQYQGQRLAIHKTIIERRDYAKLVATLEKVGVLQERKDFSRRSVFNIIGREHDIPEEIACAVDPFAYVSHLSAMAYHGLTNRIPEILFLSSPAPAKWREFARERMVKDFEGDYPAYLQSRLPRLTRIDIVKIGRRPVNRYASVHLGAFKSVKDRPLKVSTIGRSFLDMLQKPELCGGIRHVLDVFEGSGERYWALIADEIDQHGKSIDKVRAGYILEKYCGLHSERIEAWLKHAQRGGSQKLDPAGEYRGETYSERWSLSINID